MPIKWTKVAELRYGVYRAQMLQLEGKLYLGGGDAPDGKHGIIQEYDTSTCVWRELTPSTVERAALAELSGQLVLAGSHAEGEAIGGRYSQLANSTRVAVWDADSSDWIHSYPPMENGRSYAAAIGYENTLVVACGLAGSKEVAAVEVLECDTHLHTYTWKQVEPVPLAGHHMSSVVIDKNWFISAHHWEDSKSHVFCANLQDVISNASNVWWELEAPPVRCATLQVYRNQLLLLGGLKRGIFGKDYFLDDIYTYKLLSNAWHEFGKLPTRMSGCSCSVLPTGELMVAGGFLAGKQCYSEQVWVGTVQ